MTLATRPHIPNLWRIFLQLGFRSSCCVKFLRVEVTPRASSTKETHSCLNNYLFIEHSDPKNNHKFKMLISKIILYWLTWNFARSFVLDQIRGLLTFSTFGWSVWEIFDLGFFRIWQHRSALLNQFVKNWKAIIKKGKLIEKAQSL